MARNKRIGDMIQGIVGNKTPDPVEISTENGDVSPELVESLEITPEMEEALNEVRKRKVGRPRKDAAERKNPNEGRATFVVDNRLIRKVKYISLVEARLLKDIISEALSDYISKWENENEPIKLPRKQK